LLSRRPLEDCKIESTNRETSFSCWRGEANQNRLSDYWIASSLMLTKRRIALYCEATFGLP
jgi:hypothetical protein